MARRASNRSTKAVIRVFCEGESEQAYIDFLKMQFQDVAAIKYPRGTGLFETAKDKFSKDPKYKDYTNEIDEVWFFFDVELKDKAKWTKRHEIMQYISKLRKKPNIKIGSAEKALRQQKATIYQISSIIPSQDMV